MRNFKFLLNRSCLTYAIQAKILQFSANDFVSVYYPAETIVKQEKDFYLWYAR